MKVNTILYFSLSSHTNNSDQHLFILRSGSRTKLFADPDRDPGFATTLRTEFSHFFFPFSGFSVFAFGKEMFKFVIGSKTKIFLGSAKAVLMSCSWSCKKIVHFIATGSGSGSSGFKRIRIQNRCYLMGPMAASLQRLAISAPSIPPSAGRSPQCAPAVP